MIEQLAIENDYWRINDEPWVDQDYNMSLRDPDGFYDAFVKLDGCVELRIAYNYPFDYEAADGRETGVGRKHDTGSIHICDIDHMIERLKALKMMAERRFGVWP